MQSGSQGGWSPLSSYYLHQARGAMSINGSHFLERALHWFGEPLDTRYVDDSEGGPEANARAELVYADFSGIVKVSRTMALKPMSAVETDQGILLHRDWQNPTLEFFPHGSMADPFVIAKGPCSMAGRPDPYRLQVEDFVASCRTGCPPKVGIEQGTAVTRLLGKLYACRRPMPDVWYRTTGETGGVQ